ncbi:MAG: alpha/beta hydrolase [Ilumatobacter sp.]|nr:alpha/beta hydrolase [Ilumatobacter sp.]
MSTAAPEAIRVETDDGDLGTIRWRGTPGAPVVFALPGMVDNAWVWSAVAQQLDGAASLVAVDLRGRGSSSDSLGPFGIRRHADDVRAVIHRFNAAPAVVVGHSLGGTVALQAAAAHPDDVSGVVLVESGPPPRIDPGVDPATRMQEILAPIADLARRVWPDRVSYEAAIDEIGLLRDLHNPEVERYLLSDLVEHAGGFRSRVNMAAVEHDLLELLSDEELRTLLDRRATPTILVQGEYGLNNAPPPVFDDSYRDRYHWHEWRTAEGCNFLSVLVGMDGAGVVARAILDEVGSVTRRS